LSARYFSLGNKNEKPGRENNWAIWLFNVPAPGGTSPLAGVSGGGIFFIIVVASL
jgi:hypothetical protein